MKTQEHIDSALKAADCARAFYMAGELEGGPMVGAILPGRKLPLYLQVPGTIGRDAAGIAVLAIMERMIERGATAIVYVTLSWAFEFGAIPHPDRARRYREVLEALSRNVPEQEIEGMGKTVMVQYSTRQTDAIMVARVAADGSLEKFDAADGETTKLTGGTLRPFERLARARANRN